MSLSYTHSEHSHNNFVLAIAYDKFFTQSSLYIVDDLEQRKEDGFTAQKDSTRSRGAGLIP